MNVAIINQATGRLTMYSPAELRRDAQHAVKGLGRLVAGQGLPLLRPNV